MLQLITMIGTIFNKVFTILLIFVIQKSSHEIIFMSSFSATNCEFAIVSYLEYVSSNNNLST